MQWPCMQVAKQLKDAKPAEIAKHLGDLTYSLVNDPNKVISMYSLHVTILYSDMLSIFREYVYGKLFTKAYFTSKLTYSRICFVIL